MKYLLYPFMFLLLPAALCAQNIDTLYHANGNIFKITEQRDAYKKVLEFSQYGKPLKSQEFRNDKLNGISLTYASNGKLEEVAHYNHGLLEGEYLKYSNNGILQHRLNYSIVEFESKSNSLIDGNAEYFHYNGNIVQKGNYRNNLKEGFWLSYDSNGNLQGKTHYHNGKLSGKKEEYYPNGLLRSKRFIYEDTLVDNIKYTNVVDGLVVQFYDNGNKQSEEYFNLGKADGSIKRWREDGQLNMEAILKNDTFRTVRYFDTDGKLSLFQEEKITQQNGYVKYLIHGKLERFSNGKLINREHYLLGKRDGPYEHYHTNGKLAAKGKMKNDKPIGQILSYHENGKLNEEVNYSEIINWNGSIRYERTGWQRRYNEKGKLVFESYTNDFGRNVYQAYYTSESKLNRRYFFIGTHYWEINYYSNGKVQSERFQLGLPQIEERYFIDGQSYFFEFRDKLNTDFRIERFAELNETKITGKESSEDLNLNYYLSNPNDFDLYSTYPKDKTFRTTYLEGNPRIEATIKDKLLNGDFKVHYPNGQIALYAMMTNGEIGKLTYQLTADGDTIMRRRKGKGKAMISIYTDGNNLYKKTIIDSAGNEVYHEERYGNGQLKLLRDLKLGIERSWMENRTLTFDKRKLNTDSNIFQIQTFYENGQMYFNYQTRNNVREGIEEVYFKNGQLSQKGNYLNGKQHGYLISYYDDGRLRLEGNMKNGEKTGWWKVNRGDELMNEFYKNGRISTAPDTSICACQDTARPIGQRSYIPTLNYLFEYDQYKRFNLNFLKTLDSSDYQRFFFRHTSTLSKSNGFFDLVMFSKIKLPFTSKNNNYIVLNACQTNGFYSHQSVRYQLNEKNFEREISFYKATFDFVFNSKIAQQFSEEDQIRIRVSTNNLTLNQNSHLSVKEQESSVCFEPIQIGNIELKNGYTALIGNMSVDDFFKAQGLYKANEYLESMYKHSTDQKALLQENIIKNLRTAPVTGFYSSRLEGSLRIDNLSFGIKAEFILLNDLWTGGSVFIEIKAIDANTITLEDKKGKEHTFSMKHIKKSMESSGLKNIQMNSIPNQNKMKISFLIPTL